MDTPDGARVQSFLVKPYGFTPARKYPVLMLIHGGPQGNWGHSWTIAGTRRFSPPRDMWW